MLKWIAIAGYVINSRVEFSGLPMLKRIAISRKFFWYQTCCSTISGIDVQLAGCELYLRTTVPLLWATALLQPSGCLLHAHISNKNGQSGWTLRAGIGQAPKLKYKQTSGKDRLLSVVWLPSAH